MVPRVLVISEFFPHPARPAEGLLVSQQIQHLSVGRVTAVVVPSVWYPPLRRYQYLRSVRPASGWSESNGLAICRVPVHCLPKVGEFWGPHEFLRATRHLLEQQSLPFDLIHAHWAYRSGYVAYRLAREFRKPLVISVLGSDANHWLYEKNKRKKLMQALHGAEAIISISQALQRRLVDHGIAGNKIFIIPQGIDLNQFSLRPSRLETHVRARFGNSFVCACIANHYPVKGLDLLLRALARTQSRIAVILIGDGPERGKLEAIARLLEIDSRVWFTGQKPHDQIPNWINAADALVLPSRNEGLPTVMVEALACGKPVVATDVGGVREVLVDANLGIIVPPENVQALAAALEAMPQRHWDHQAIRRRGQDFSWDQFNRKLGQVYHHVLGTASHEISRSEAASLENSPCDKH